MSLRYHEIAETNHRILNPFTKDQLKTLGEICRPSPKSRLLDLACGKGEMLCRWAKKYGLRGTGVDISEVFLKAAKDRAIEFGVVDRVTFVLGDAGKYAPAPQVFDLVSCIGATWIGDGLIGTIELMKLALKPGGLLLVGEPFWIDPPPQAAYAALGVEREEFASLEGTLDRFESAGMGLVEMVLANRDSWDRYVAPQWMAVDNFLREHPGDPDTLGLRKWNDQNRRSYLQYGRRYFGWGVFVLRETQFQPGSGTSGTE